MWRPSPCTHNCACLGAMPTCDGKHDFDLPEEGLLKMILHEHQKGHKTMISYFWNCNRAERTQADVLVVLCMNIHCRFQCNRTTHSDDRKPELGSCSFIDPLWGLGQAMSPLWTSERKQVELIISQLTSFKAPSSYWGLCDTRLTHQGLYSFSYSLCFCWSREVTGKGDYSGRAFWMSKRYMCDRFGYMRSEPRRYK